MLQWTVWTRGRHPRRIIAVWRQQPLTGDAGMSTAEYAIGTIAAAAFAALLYAVVTGDSVLAGLTSLIEQALSTPV